MKVVKALTIDDVADGTYTLSERESSKGNGETSIAMALIMMYFASDSKVVFTSEQDNRYATTTVTTEGDVKVFHTVGKSASGFDCNVTVKESATTPFTYLYIDGWFFMETTETDEDGDRTSVDNHVLIEYKGDDRAWIDYSMDVVETSVMNKMEAKEEFTELIGSDAVEYPEKIITAGEKSKELFGNVECDRYTLTGELIDDDETYKSGTLYMYKNIPLKFSGKVMDSAGMESETSIELRIYIE